MKLLIRLLPLTLTLIVFETESISLTVTLSNGNKLIGIEQESLYNGRKFHEYRGIPYAKAPVGQLRFKSPVPYDLEWTEPRDASTYGNVCPQDDVLNEPLEEGHVEETVQPMGDEDCLFINVATPSKKREGNKPYPVIVWIHGGSFLYENGNAYGPNKFMDFDCVFVTFNFRLGVLGFINTGDGKIQGNMGLKDQVLALKWVKENIRAFGGDPDRVTLMGVSSGAVSAHLHMLSPMSEGLFHQAVLQSGTAISPWVLQQNSTNVALFYTKWLNCTTADNQTLSTYDCLMKTDTETLIRKQPRLIDWFIDPMVPMGPSIEKEGKEPRFLDQNPYQILASGKYWAKDKVTLIAGVNSHEGLLHSWDIAHHVMLARVLNMEWRRAIPITLSFRETGLNFKNISDSVHEFYFADNNEDSNNTQDQTIEEETGKKKKKWKHIGYEYYKFEELTQMYSDRNFFIPIHKTGFLHAKMSKAPVYLYWFDYVGSQSSTQFSNYNDTVVGASHYDQIQYLFNTPYFKDPENPDEIQFGRKFTGGLMRFVQTGEPPAGGWVAINKHMVEGTVPFLYNRFGDKKDALQLIEPFEKSVEFWDKLPILEYGKTKDDFPEFVEEKNKEPEGSEHLTIPGLPGVTLADLQKIKDKLEL